MRDEARLLGLLQDDAILAVLDMVRVAGRDAVVMEYVEGVDLDTIAESGASPSPRALAELGSAVAGGLNRAHVAAHPTTGEPLNVIHRDVKPANVMVTRGGGVKLLDFGVARARFDSRESHTGQLVLGTLNYMAPEYIVTGEVSPAADVYGLGLTLWQLAARAAYGQPKVRQDAHEKRLANRLDRIRTSHPSLVPLLERMLAWSPEVRPTAAEAETLLLDAADAAEGGSLRGWARRVVPEVLAGRGQAPDSAGLLGQTVEIDGEGDGGAPTGQGESESETPAREGAAAAVWDPGGIAPAPSGPPSEPPIRVDKPHGTPHTVSTSRAEPAPTTSGPPGGPDPSNPPAPAVAPAAGGSSPLPVGMIAAGAVGGLLMGLLVVAAAAFLLLR